MMHSDTPKIPRDVLVTPQHGSFLVRQPQHGSFLVPSRGQIDPRPPPKMHRSIITNSTQPNAGPT
eukprot:4947198-Karenia_brevis.AAC.1